MQRLTIFLFLILFLSNAHVPTGQAAEVEDGILAVVNDDVITLSELAQYLNSRAMQLKLEGRSPDEIRTIMAELRENGLNRIIEEKIILAEANKKGMTIRNEAIDERIAEIKNRYTSEQEFTAALAASGATVTDVRNKISDQFKIKYLIDDEIRGKIHVNPQEVTEYYNTHQKEFARPEAVNLDSIFIPSDKEDAKKKADDALAALKSGRTFTDVAKEYSQAPSIGTIARGEMLPAIENAVFQLKEGEISPLVEANNGIYIFKLNKKLPAAVAPLDDVKKQINDYINQVKFKEKFSDWVEKLKKKSFIEIKE